MSARAKKVKQSRGGWFRRKQRVSSRQQQRREGVEARDESRRALLAITGKAAGGLRVMGGGAARALSTGSPPPSPRVLHRAVASVVGETTRTRSGTARSALAA